MSETVFLLSSERSGSNLLRVMMDSHARISAPHSPHLINLFVPLLPKYGDLQDSGRFQQLAEDVRHVVTIQLRDWPHVPDLADLVHESKERSFAGLMNSLYGLAAAKAGKQRSFIKDNGAIPFATDVTLLFPKAKFVYLVRDARDVALSWKKSPGHPGGVKEAATMWQKEQERALHFISLAAQTDLIHRVHYENLIADPASQLRQICEFIGESFDPAMLQFHQGDEAKTSAQAAVGWNNLVKPVLTGNTKKYQSGLSVREQRTIEKIAGGPMVQLGYQLDHKPKRSLVNPATPGRLARAGRVAFQQLLRGPAGVRELKQRTKRLQGLREILSRMESSRPDWTQTKDSADHRTEPDQ